VSVVIEEQSGTVAFMKEIFSLMNSSNSTYSLLNSIHQSLQSVIYAENFFVVLLNSQKRYVTFPFYKDVKDSMSIDSLNKVPLEDIFSTLTFYAIKKKKIVCLTKDEINQLLDVNEVKIIGSVPEQWLCFPLQYKGKFFGNFVVQSYRSKDEYNENDIEILGYISGVIATAIFLFNKNIELEKALIEVESNKDLLEVKIQQRTAELEDTLQSLKQEMIKSKTLEKQLTFEVFHDSLTQLYNRKFFADQLEIEASKAEREVHQVTLAYMDLDGFKQINDNFGHDCGDVVLKAIADRLRLCFRRHDNIVRIGGDEFVLLITVAINDPDMMKLFNRLIELVSQPIAYKDSVVNVGISIGLSASDKPDVIREQLLVQADNALYQSKSNGKGQICKYKEQSKDLVHTSV